ncbi:MAG: hypothetical protein VX463_19715 [Pseudomonadota bacterium]|nr:hypothetical protein [Pseudomonadota bacterium]
MSGQGWRKASRVATEAELAASLAVHGGASVREAAERHGAEAGGVANLVQSRFGGVADLRRVPNASDLEIVRHEAVNAREFWARIGVERPGAETAKPAETFRTSPFPVTTGREHHDDPAVRLRAFRDGVGPFRHRDLTGAILGDPPVGRSALDRNPVRGGGDWRALPRPKPVSEIEAAATLRRLSRRARAA